MQKSLLLVVFLLGVFANSFTTTAQTEIPEYYIVKLSPDEQLAAGAAYNRTTVEFFLRIWDANTGAILTHLEGNTAPLLDFAWSPDGKRLIGSDGNFNVIVWCTDQTNVTCAFGNEITSLEGLTAAVNALDWHSNNLLVTASRYGNFSIQTWDMSTYTVIDSLSFGEIGDIAWSPDGSKIAVGGNYDGVYVLNADLSLANGRLSDYRISGDHDVSIQSVAWDQDGSRLAYGTVNHIVAVIDPSTGEELGRLQAHDYPVYALAWSPDNTQLATASNIGTIIVWNPTTDVWNVVETIEKQTTSTYSVFWKADGTLLYPDASDFPVGLPTSIPTLTHTP